MAKARHFYAENNAFEKKWQDKIWGSTFLGESLGGYVGSIKQVEDKGYFQKFPYSGQLQLPNPSLWDKGYFLAWIGEGPLPKESLWLATCRKSQVTWLVGVKLESTTFTVFSAHTNQYKNLAYFGMACPSLFQQHHQDLNTCVGSPWITSPHWAVAGTQCWASLSSWPMSLWANKMALVLSHEVLGCFLRSVA